ncbi:MAG: glycosyltransferase [Lentilitoribacter sp.]
MTNNGISVVIPCLNEQGFLGSLLDDLSQQNIDNQEFEVIVVDNNSSDGTAEVAWNFAADNPEFNLKMIHEYDLGVSKARNRGARFASYSTLVFLDADNRVTDTFLKTMQTKLSIHEVVGGTIRTTPDRFELKGHLVFWILEGIKILLPRPFGKSFVRKQIHDDLGGFNENITLGENLEYLMRVKSYARSNRLKFVHSKIGVSCSLRRFDELGYVIVLFSWLKAYLGDFKQKYPAMPNIQS